MRSSCPLLLVWCASLAEISACDLCAVYNANNAQSARGFTFTVAEQFVPYDTLLLEGDEVSVPNPDYLDESITHLVPAYNLTERIGVGLNVPIVYRRFRRTAFQVAPDNSTSIITESGTVFDLGDISLIGRLSFLQIKEMTHEIAINLLAGVKFPTGKTERLEDEVRQARRYDAFAGPGHVHDVLGVPLGSVHQHELSPGSGSFDGVFGVTLNTRMDRWFFRSEAQYYLRTEGAADFSHGDELILSGGPGAFALLHKDYTLSLQANAVYQTEARAKLDGEKSNHTGMTAWYLGPQLALSWGARFSANAGIDLPLWITNNGFQNVPDWRVHFGFTWGF